MLENIVKTIRFIFTGQWRRVWNEVHVRLYRGAWAVLWFFFLPLRTRRRAGWDLKFSRDTDFPVAFASPDHIAPKGTAVNNSTNKKFILHMDAKLRREFGAAADLRMMDLGCAGGQTIDHRAFHDVGLAGSRIGRVRLLVDISARELGALGEHPFLDITKPYPGKLDAKPARFHLVTEWEVMEHVATPDLAAVFHRVDSTWSRAGISSLQPLNPATSTWA